MEITNKQFIDGCIKIFEAAMPVLKEEAKNAASAIKEDAAKQWKDFLEEIQKDPRRNITCEEIQLLDSPKLIAIAKENIVKGANEVYAWKKQVEKNHFVYLAYGKNQEMFEQDKNKFVVIKSDELSSDLTNLFEESELIILN